MHTEFWWGILRVRDLLGRPRRGWGDGIKMDLREVGCEPRDWIALAEDRDQCTVGQNANLAGKN